MAKIYTDRIIQKFGLEPNPDGSWKGLKYSDVCARIISHNTDNIARKIIKTNQDSWNKASLKISTKEKRFIVPDQSDILPKRAPHIIKAADSGKLISQTLRDELTKNLRDSLNQFTPVTGEQTYITRRGAKAGRINPKVIKQFQDKITDTFQNYVKKDPSIGMPPNIATIAITEMRNTITTTKHLYMETLRSKNPDVKFKKIWIQNKGLSNHFRKSHNAVNGKTIDIDDKFKVPEYKKIAGKWVRTGNIIEMDRPYDPDAPLSEKIGCSCDIEHIAQRVK
jgi:hypothetical protein